MSIWVNRRVYVRKTLRIVLDRPIKPGKYRIDLVIPFSYSGTALARAYEFGNVDRVVNERNIPTVSMVAKVEQNGGRSVVVLPLNAVFAAFNTLKTVPADIRGRTVYLRLQPIE